VLPGGISAALNTIYSQVKIRGSDMSTDFTESIVEEAALSWFEELLISALVSKLLTLSILAGET
jgi:hypothetical protein